MTDQPTPQDALDARRLILADGECSPCLPLPAMVLRLLEQRNRARAALRVAQKQLEDAA